MDENEILAIGIVIAFLICFLAGIFFGIFYGIEAIVCNSTIPTQDGWKYLGEGKITNTKGQSCTTDCYGINECANHPNSINSIPIYNDAVYTPIQDGNNFHKVGFASQIGLTHYPDHLNNGTNYKIYERDFWWDKQYLVTCE